MREVSISLARDFSRHPGPRTNAQGRNSGERFRRLLVEKLKNADVVAVDLDGTSGIGSSFLDEVFGGLVRYEGFLASDVLRRVRVKSDLDESYLITIQDSIDRAKSLATA